MYVLQATFSLALSILLCLTSESKAQAPLYQKFSTEIKAISLQPASAPEKNKKINDSEYRVVIFWASWCPYCKQALRDLDEYFTKESVSPEQLSILAISLDEKKDLAEKFVKEERSSHISYAYTISNREKRNKLGVTTLPTIYILNKNGDIVSDYRGYGLETATYLSKKLRWYIKNEASVD